MASKLLGKSNNYEKIIAFMRDELAESDLTDHEQLMLRRWNEAFSLMRNYNSIADAAAILMKRFPGLSRATAYRDCSNAISLFGDITKSSKEGIRHLATEITRDAIEIARASHDGALMMKGALNITKINGVNITDPDLPDFDQLEPHTYEYTLDPKMIKALQIMLSQGKVDFTQLTDIMSSIADDAIVISETKDEPNRK